MFGSTSMKPLISGYRRDPGSSEFGGTFGGNVIVNLIGSAGGPVTVDHTFRICATTYAQQKILKIGGLIMGVR